jgi:hypothetical protein
MVLMRDAHLTCALNGGYKLAAPIACMTAYVLITSAKQKYFKGNFMTKLFRRFVSYALVISLGGLPFTAQAGMIGTDEAMASTGVQNDRAKVRDFMSRSDVEAQLQQHGLTREAAQERVNALSDAEVQHLAGKIDTLPAGATSGAAAVVGLTVLLVAVTYILVRTFYPQK